MVGRWRQLRCLSALLLAGAWGCATTEASTRPTFDHVALHVRDLETSLAFYRDVLGLEQVPDPFHDGRHVFLRMGKGSELHLLGGGAADAKHDSFHFAIRVSAFQEALTRLHRKGVRYYDSNDVPDAVTRRPDGVQQVYLQDPDGYWVEVNDRSP